MHIRFSVPNWSIRSAGPPALTTRSLISVISRSASTSAAIRTSSPSRSRRAIHSRRSAGGAIAQSVYGRECEVDCLVDRERTALLDARAERGIARDTCDAAFVALANGSDDRGTQLVLRGLAGSPQSSCPVDVQPLCGGRSEAGEAEVGDASRDEVSRKPQTLAKPIRGLVELTAHEREVAERKRVGGEIGHPTVVTRM